MGGDDREEGGMHADKHGSDAFQDPEQLRTSQVGGAELPLHKCPLGLPFRIHTETSEAAAGVRLQAPSPF